MAEIPSKLQEQLDLFQIMPDRQERIEALMSIADRFHGVPESVAQRPYPESHRVPHCESQAYAWVVPLGEGRFEVHYAVENPQGIAAQSTAVILAESLRGATLEEILAVQPESVFTLFAGELSLPKRMGLAALVTTTQQLAREAAGADS